MSPVKTTKKMLQWSYSRYKDWKGCAFRARCKHVDKIGQFDGGDTKATYRGTDIHATAMEWASKKNDRGELSKLLTIPKELLAFKHEFNVLRRSKNVVVVERRDVSPKSSAFGMFAWGFTAKWETSEFFADDVWVRQKIDTYEWAPKTKVLRIIDYKTGRIYPPDNAEQMELYGLAGLLKFPDAVRVETELWYLDREELVAKTFTRIDLPKLQAVWNARVAPMLADTIFRPNPTVASKYGPKQNPVCGWCDYAKSNGGPCQHG